jgi:hypothetical protein
MASTTLVPTAITDTDANVASGAATDIDNTIASANDSALVASTADQWTNAPGTVTFTMSDLPGDFGSVNTVQFRVRAQFVNPGSGDQAQYDFAVAGTNAPATTASWDETDAGAGFANRGAGSPVSSSASEADINGWTVTWQQPAAQYVKDKGFDGLNLDISEIEIIVDYDAAAPSTGSSITVLGVG